MKLRARLAVNGMTPANRVAVPAMVTRLSGEGGIVTADVIDRYARYAAGRVGLIVVEDDGPAVVVEATKSNKYADRSVLGGLTYRYYMRAFDQSGGARVPSNADTIEMPPPEMVAAANQEDFHV